MDLQNSVNKISKILLKHCIKLQPFADLVLQCLDLVGESRPINPSKCNYIVIGWTPPLQLLFATRSQGESTQVASVVLDFGVPKNSSFSPLSIAGAASKARCMLFVIRLSFAKPSLSAFPPPFLKRWFGPNLSTLCKPVRRTLLPTRNV